MKRNDLSRSLVAFDQVSTMVSVVELSFRTWLVAGLVPGGIEAYVIHPTSIPVSREHRQAL
jgi:hypothetical protein